MKKRTVKQWDRFVYDTVKEATKGAMGLVDKNPLPVVIECAILKALGMVLEHEWIELKDSPVAKPE